MISLVPLAGHAQPESKRFKNELQLTAGLDSYLAFEIEPSYSYMVHKNVGVKVGMRCVGEVVDNLRYDLVGGPVHQWRVSEKRKIATVLFSPALRLRLPLVDDWFSFITEPGILLNLIPNEKVEFAYINTETFEVFPSNFRTVKNAGGGILFYHLKSYFSMIFDNWGMSVGYDFSTFDIYSGRRNIVIEGDALNTHLPPKKKHTHTVFAGASYFF